MLAMPVPACGVIDATAEGIFVTGWRLPDEAALLPGGARRTFTTHSDQPILAAPTQVSMIKIFSSSTPQRTAHFTRFPDRSLGKILAQRPAAVHKLSISAAADADRRRPANPMQCPMQPTWLTIKNRRVFVSGNEHAQ